MASDINPTSARAGGRAFAAMVRDIADFAGFRGVLAAIYIALGAVFESVGLVLLVPLLGLVIGGAGMGTGSSRYSRLMAQGFGAFGVTTQFGRLALLLGAFTLVMIVRGVVIILRDRTVMGLQISYVENFRSRIANALAQAGWDRVLRLRHARILNIMGSDIQRVGQAAHFLLQSTIASVILLAQCILSFALSPALAMFSFALLAVGAVAMVPTLRRARALGRFVGFQNLSLIDMASQFLSGLKLALSQDLQGGFLLEYQGTVRELAQRQIDYYVRQSATRVALTTISAMVGGAVMLVGYSALGLSAPVLIAFILVIARMSGPATQIQQGFQQLAHGLPAYESISELLDELRVATAAPTEPRTAPLAGEVVFDHVAFQHPHTDDTHSHGVRELSFAIAPGSMVGVAGTSGAGKTTFADLLVGLLRPQAGQVRVGGVALDEATLPAWRSQLSYISQDPFLFHDTVRRNLQWANPKATEADMWDALTLAGAQNIVRRMEGGIDAVVGERGSLVSGGERQRFALARGLLRKPTLLVMDEATNAIDIDGERVLLERLRAFSPRPTIVLIAHRAETLALCDRVLQMENGLLAESSARGLAP
jgi:ATP-binding cassette subfamily C protein